MKHLATILSVLALGCSTEFAFQTPRSWEDRYTDLAIEYGLPDAYPDLGERPGTFSCAVPTETICLLVVGDPSSVTFHILNHDATWGASATLPATGPVVEWRMPDDTRVWVAGNLVIFGGHFTELDDCDAPNALPPEPARCSY